MARFGLARRWALRPAGAFFLLVAWVLLASPSARGGCAHLVTSRTERALLPSLLLEVNPDGGIGAAGPDLPRPMPRSPRPCQGSWCDDHPSVPAAPAGTRSDLTPSWAWYAAMPDPASTPPSRFIDLAARPGPVHRAIAIFHPPRRFSFA